MRQSTMKNLSVAGFGEEVDRTEYEGVLNVRLIILTLENQHARLRVQSNQFSH